MDDLHVVARGECVNVRADRHGKFLARSCAASGIVSATAAARTPGIAANSCRQKRPNAPHPSSPTPSLASGIIGFERFQFQSFLVRIAVARDQHYAHSTPTELATRPFLRSGKGTARCSFQDRM